MAELKPGELTIELTVESELWREIDARLSRLEETARKFEEWAFSKKPETDNDTLREINGKLLQTVTALQAERDRLARSLEASQNRSAELFAENESLKARPSLLMCPDCGYELMHSMTLEEVRQAMADHNANCPVKEDRRRDAELGAMVRQMPLGYALRRGTHFGMVEAWTCANNGSCSRAFIEPEGALRDVAKPPSIKDFQMPVTP